MLHDQLVAQAREAGVQEERQRLAQDIHDSLAQGFTGIITQLEAAQQAGWSEVYGADVEVFADGSHTQLPAPLEVALLGVAREALNNAAKHADAHRVVVVTLSVLDDRALLDVRDDGRGFDPDLTAPFVGTDDHTGYGLTTMRQRVERLGGRLTIETEPGSGTAISAEVPRETHDV